MGENRSLLMTFTVVGLGHKEASGRIQRALSWIGAQITTQKKYAQNSETLFVHHVFEHICLCFGGINSFKLFVVTCSGDSGGPLLFLDNPEADSKDQDPEFDYVVGIVSFGPEPCGSRGFPGVYTRITSFSSWITCIMKSPPDPASCIEDPNVVRDVTGGSVAMELSCTYIISVSSIHIRLLASKFYCPKQFHKLSPWYFASLIL